MLNAALLRDGAPVIERIDPRLLGGDPIYIFNIYSITETVNLGTNGMYFVPPCPAGEAYVRSPSVIPGTVEGTYPHFGEREEYRARPVPGSDVARCVLGIDEGPNVDRRRFGWFTSTNAVPTKAELAEAKKHLVAFLTAKVRKGDELAASADPALKMSVDDSFYDAAHFLNVKKNWMSEATEMTLCPFCSVSVRPTASKCSGCGEIINAALYEAQKKQIAGAV